MSPMTAAQERERIVAWLRQGVGMELMKMRLMAGMPGDKPHVRAKNRSRIDGAEWLLKTIVASLERGEYHPSDTAGNEA